MEHYFEQTLTAAEKRKGRVLLMLSWVLIAALALLSVAFASTIFATTGDGALSINWISAVALVLCLGIAFVIWRQKDRLRVEYDYAIRDGRLEVAAVLNNRRRVPKLSVEIKRIISCGPGSAPANLKAEKLWLNEAARLIHICYESKDGRKAALLELNEEMANALKTSRDLMRGAWRE